MSSLFFDKLVSRIDKIDPVRLQTHFLRLQRERKALETIFQSIQEGVIVLDNAGRLSDANHAAEKLLGFDAEKLRGKPMMQYIGDLDIMPSEDSTDEAASTADWQHIITRELEVDYPEHHILSVYAVPLQAVEEDDEPSILVILRDVTSEREREASALEGERIDAIKQLAAGVAHEIGNPLNALNIHLQLMGRQLRGLEDESMRSEMTELVDVAKNEVVRLDGIIRQFLSAIRPRKPNLIPDDAMRILSETLNVMRVDIENRRIEVKVNAIGNIPKVLIDQDQMKQVFFNLIKNAMEAMPDGGQLHVSMSAGDALLRIDFQDNGCGIPEDELGRIFDAYHTTKEKGTGLGLMIVQRIVRDHGGQIEVSSKQGEGTRFRVLIPLAERRIRKITSQNTRQ